MRVNSVCLSLIGLASVGCIAARAGAKVCPADSVLAGPVCVDKYEASVWKIPATDPTLLAKVQAGTATLADLTAGGAVQNGCLTGQTAYPAKFPGNGNWTQKRYAVSVAGVLPTTCTSWFQAEQACALSGKRLLTNQEWQRAAAGTPDNTDDGATECNTSSAGTAVNTGSRSNCKSAWGAFDMVGNVWEWVADWVPASTGCGSWGTFSDDLMCLSGASTTAPGPGALIRGGNSSNGTGAGVFALTGDNQPSSSVVLSIGFRCAR